MTKTRVKQLTEEDLASIGELYMQAKGWECYPEVVIPIFGGRPDIIGTKGGLCLVAEVKKSLSYPVIEQLTRWHFEYKQAIESEYQDEATKAVPSLMVAIVAGNPVISDLKRSILERHRIGVWVVTDGYGGRPFPRGGDGKVAFLESNWHVTEVIEAKLQPGSRRTAGRIIEHLNKDMRIGRSGASGKEGAYMTPFKRTMVKVNAYLDSRLPGAQVHIDDIVDSVNKKGGHHYANDASARNSIKSALERDGHQFNWGRLSITPTHQA